MVYSFYICIKFKFKYEYVLVDCKSDEVIALKTE